MSGPRRGLGLSRPTYSDRDSYAEDQQWQRDNPPPPNAPLNQYGETEYEGTEGETDGSYPRWVDGAAGEEKRKRLRKAFSDGMNGLGRPTTGDPEEERAYKAGQASAYRSRHEGRDRQGGGGRW